MCACARASTSWQPLRLKRRQPRSSSRLIGVGALKGGDTHAAPPKITSSPKQLSSSSARQTPPPGGCGRVCACVPTLRRGRKRVGEGAGRAQAQSRVESAPSGTRPSFRVELAPRPLGSQLLIKTLTERSAWAILELRLCRLPFRALPPSWDGPGPALTTFVSRSSAGSQPRSRGPQQSRQTSARQR